MAKTREEKLSEGEGCVTFLLLFILVAFITNAYRGLVIAKLWQWFVADTFHVYALSTVQAIGLSEVLNLLVVHSTAGGTMDTENPVSVLARRL